MATFSVPSILETAYRGAISKLVMSWLPEDLKDISDGHWLRELANVSTRKSVVSSASKLALNMITRVNVVNAKSWRELAIRTQKSGVLYDLLSKELSGRIGVRVNSLIEQNARYIADIPADVASSLAKDIAKAQQQGTRSSEIRKALAIRFPELLNSKISMIARTQCSGASTALTRARSEELDISCFVWETSQDGFRVRPSHRNMQGVVVFWNDLPSPEQLIGQKDYLGHYAAGDCPNCRCNPLPVLTVEDVYIGKRSVARVYTEGKIVQMTRANFTRQSGIESRLVA